MTREVTQADIDLAVRIANLFGKALPHDADTFPAQWIAEHRLTAQSGEGRSGAGEDAGPFHVSQSGDGKKLWFSARDPASGVTIPARDRTDARNLVSSLNHACATFAALNARQSGEGEREATLEAALWSVLSYDQLLRQYEGPQAILFAGDVEKIDATYDAMIAKVTSALRATDDAGGAK